MAVERIDRSFLIRVFTSAQHKYCLKGPGSKNRFNNGEEDE
jgi:hypothetical protein